MRLIIFIFAIVLHASSSWANVSFSTFLEKSEEKKGDVRVVEERRIANVQMNGKHDRVTVSTTKTEYENNVKKSQKFYDANGNLFVENAYEEGNVRIKKVYHPSKRFLWMEMPYKDGKMHGQRKEYREDGGIAAITHYKDGQLHGIWKSWNYKTHHLVRSENYVKGKMDGEQSYFNPDNGKLKRIELYENGKWLQSKEYDERGEYEVIQDINKYQELRDVEFKKLFSSK